MKAMKSSTKRFISVIFCILALSAVCIAAKSIRLSPALEEIEKQIELKKCGIAGSTVKFDEADFDGLFRTKAEFIKIESLPDSSDGKLAIGSISLAENQLIARDDFNKIIFSPAHGDVCTAAFSFSNATVGQTEVTAKCTVNLLDELNLAPEVGTQSVNTAKNISAFKFLKAADPENDGLSFEIVSYPAHGTVTVLDGSDGYFCYTPKDGYVGKDSFEYTASDVYGNKSKSAVVEIKVSRPASDVYFNDLENHWAHNSAVKTAAMGLMGGSYDDNGNYNFEPESDMSRGDFLAMALISAGKEEYINFVPETSFSDDSSIPVNIKSYVEYAADNGIISGYTNEYGEKVFASSSPITRAEAAVIVNNILSLPESKSDLGVFTDAEYVPVWATSAISNLTSYGIFNGTGFGEIKPESIVTKAETAEILCNISSYTENINEK